jgi:hypothetical protein
MSESYVRFTEDPVTGGRKTKLFSVYGTNNGILLGKIKFYPQWRQFVFVPSMDTLFNSGCMRDILAFCDEQTQTWREGVAARA